MMAKERELTKYQEEEAQCRTVTTRIAIMNSNKEGIMMSKDNTLTYHAKPTTDEINPSPHKNTVL